jgi:hypothetical protein
MHDDYTGPKRTISQSSQLLSEHEMRIDDFSRHKGTQGPDIVGSDRVSDQQGSEKPLYNELFPIHPIPAVDRGASATVFKVSDPPANEDNEAAAIEFLTKHGYYDSRLNHHIASSPTIREVAEKYPNEIVDRVFKRAWSAMLNAKKSVELRSGKQEILQGLELDRFFSRAAQHLKITPDEVYVDKAFIAEEVISRRWSSSEGANLPRDAVEIQTTGADDGTASGPPQSRHEHSFGLRIVEPPIIAKDDVIERIDKYVQRGGNLTDLAESLEGLADRYGKDSKGLIERAQIVTKGLDADLLSLDSALKNHPDPVLARLGEAIREISNSLKK